MNGARDTWAAELAAGRTGLAHGADSNVENHCGPSSAATHCAGDCTDYMTLMHLPWWQLSCRTRAADKVPVQLQLAQFGGGNTTADVLGVTRHALSPVLCLFEP